MIVKHSIFKCYFFHNQFVSTKFENDKNSYKHKSYSSLHLCASVTKQHNLVPAKGVISFAGKVTTGLVMESNGSLWLGLWLMSPVGSAKKPGSAPCPTLIIEYETTLLYLH